MKDDFLYGTGYRITQGKNLYHFNSDSELLGHFLRLKHSDTVLDIGTGSGVLLLYAAAQKPKELHGIDLFDEVIAQAADNCKRNGVEAFFTKAKVQEYTGGPFDAILCNPPYFKTDNPALISEDEKIAAARHEVYLTPEDLFASALRLSKDSGRLFMVHRASRLNELLFMADAYGWRAVRMRIAYASQKGIAKSVLLELRRHTKQELKIEPPAFLDKRETFIL